MRCRVNVRTIVGRSNRLLGVAFIVIAIFGSVRGASASVLTLVPPTAEDDAYSMQHNQTLAVDAPGVLANDTLPAGPIWDITIVSTSYGGITLDQDGSFPYQPPTNWIGTDFFVYQIAAETASTIGPDAQHAAGEVPILSDTATVTITVTDAAPIAVDDAYATDQDTELTVDAPGVLANDSDPDGDPLIITSLLTGPTNGSVNLDLATGGFTYIPHEGFVGTDSFSYVLDDVHDTPQKQQVSGAGGDDTATVTIQVSGIGPTATVPAEVSPTAEPGAATATAMPPAPTAPAGDVNELPATGGGPGNNSEPNWLAVVLVASGLFLSGIALRVRSTRRG
jgi:hypothetical protein